MKNKYRKYPKKTCFLFQLWYNLKDMKKIYSVNEAGELMGISGRRVRKLLSEGRIQGEKVGAMWIVTKLGYKTKKRGYPKRK